MDGVPEDEILLLFTNIQCVGKFQLILGNPRNIQRMNAVGN